MADYLQIWVVYYDPLDYHGKYVARLFEGPHRTSDVLISDTLQGIRELLLKEGTSLGHNLARLNRDPDDDRVIVETWV